MEWTSVEKELPPMNQKFDVWDNHHKKRIADHGAFVGEWDDQFRKETMLIKGHTHWMLQPPPPSSHNSDYAKCPECGGDMTCLIKHCPICLHEWQ